MGETTAEKRTVKRKTKFKFFSIRSGIDMPFLCILLILLSIGLVMMFSASYAYGYYYYDDSYMFISSQALWAVLGLVAMFVVSYVDYHQLHKFAIPILALALLLLFIALFMPAINNVHRWIIIPGLGQFQP